MCRSSTSPSASAWTSHPAPESGFPVRGGETRGFVSIARGDVTGPRLEGEVIAGSGGDCRSFAATALSLFDARYLIPRQGRRNHPGLQPWLCARTAGCQARINRGGPVAPAENYFRLSPTFETERAAAIDPSLNIRRCVRIATVEDLDDCAVLGADKVTGVKSDNAVAAKDRQSPPLPQ